MHAVLRPAFTAFILYGAIIFTIRKKRLSSINSLKFLAGHSLSSFTFFHRRDCGTKCLKTVEFAIVTVIPPATSMPRSFKFFFAMSDV